MLADIFKTENILPVYRFKNACAVLVNLEFWLIGRLKNMSSFHENVKLEDFTFPDDAPVLQLEKNCKNEIRKTRTEGNGGREGS